MYIKINSVTNGFLDNYPKYIFISYFKHKHWRELSLVNSAENEDFEDVLTSIFDDVIDFEKTGFIKTSDELLIADRFKLFLFQVVNSKTDTLKFKYNCSNPDCKGDFELVVNLLNLKEIKLNKKIDKLWLDEDKKYFFKFPTREDLRKQNKMLIYHKEKVLEEIRKVKEKYEGDEEKIKEEIYKILDYFYVRTNLEDVKDIKIVNDVDFDNYSMELIALMSFVGGLEINDLLYYLNFMYNDNTVIFKNLLKYASENIIGYDTKIKFKCKHCNKNYEEELPLIPKFFFM